MSSVISLLSEWLQHPVLEIRMSPSDEVAQLRVALDEALVQIDQLQSDLKIMRSKYFMSCEMNMRYMDLLNSQGIDHRHIREV